MLHLSMFELSPSSFSFKWSALEGCVWLGLRNMYLKPLPPVLWPLVPLGAGGPSTMVECFATRGDGQFEIVLECAGGNLSTIALE